MGSVSDADLAAMSAQMGMPPMSREQLAAGKEALAGGQGLFAGGVGQGGRGREAGGGHADNEL